MDSIYGHKSCAQKLVFADEVLDHFGLHRQTAGPEVGGQLFGTFAGGIIRVTLATGPRSKDKKRRFLFIPSRVRERREITVCFMNGLHYLGDWHTHPEVSPRPSNIDLNSMRDCFTKSRHEHRAFVMVIVGNGSGKDDWLWISLHDANEHLRLEPIAESPKKSLGNADGVQPQCRPYKPVDSRSRRV